MKKYILVLEVRAHNGAKVPNWGSFVCCGGCAKNCALGSYYKFSPDRFYVKYKHFTS